MSKPHITEKIGGYEFNWADEQLNISVSRLRTHSSDGRVTGELFITSSLVGNKPIYPQTSFNFNSDRTRSSLIKALTETYPKWQWAEIINQLCLGIVERARQGEPVRELWTHEDVSSPKFLLEPIIYKGLPTITFGEKAVCKSILTIAIYACLILPWHDNPLGWVVSDKSVKVLLLDYEADYEITQYNAKRLQEGMNLPPFPISYRRSALPLADDIEQIQKYMSNIGAEVLIVDSLGPAVGGDLKDPGQALRFTSALRQLKCASLIIGQTSKERESKHKSVYGSTFFEYYARNIFELRKVQEEGEDELDIALFNTYCNLGKKVRPMGFHISFDDVNIKIERKEITAAELIERLGTQARILDLLKLGAMTAKEIIDTLEVRRNTVDVSLKRLRDKEKITKVGDKWGLLAQTELI